MAPRWLERSKEALKRGTSSKRHDPRLPSTSSATRPKEELHPLPHRPDASSTREPSSATRQSETLPPTPSPPGEPANQPNLPEPPHGSQALQKQPETSIPSLWGRAYDALRAEDTRLVEKYEDLLARELPGTASGSNLSVDNSPGVEELCNHLDNANMGNRQLQLKSIVECGLQRAHDKKIKYTIAGHEFVLKDQIAQAAKFIKQMKGFIDEAVKVSPEASLAWAGVSLILPILTIPSAAEKANNDGFTYVISRLRYYVELERLLWPASLDHDGLKAELEDHFVKLYQRMLDFQIKSVLRFYGTWVKNLWGDFLDNNWGEMRSEIEKLEKVVMKECDRINTFVSRQNLEALNKNAEASLRDMETLLSVAMQQVSYLGQIAENTESPVNLTVAKHAIYNSAEDQDIPLCLPGTRVGILDNITTWAASLDTETMFLLSGPAGTGKSTISRTLAHSLASKRRLGASYFFKRADETRNGTDLFFATIADQLVRTVPPFGARLKESLKPWGNVGPENVSLDEQFRILVQAPLSECHDYPGNLEKVVVIDALDECKHDEHVSRIVDLLSRLRETTAVRLRVFVTSRSTEWTVRAFKALDKKKVLYRKLALEEESLHGQTMADISVFLERRFADIKDKWDIPQEEIWPEQKELDRLVSLATTPSPLFIYAVTLCRFVDDAADVEPPRGRLEVWLKQCDSDALQLSQIYMPILEDVFRGSYNMRKKPSPLSDQNRLQLLQLLGAIILFGAPLPAKGIEALLGLPKDSIGRWLQKFHAVLSIPRDSSAPVRLFHKSFSDFLLGRAAMGSADFRIDAAEIHEMLASKCIQRMKTGLRKDICGIEDLGKSKDEIGKDTVAGQIPSDLEYACLYWVHHLRYRGRPIEENDLGFFIHEHFLHWLEAMSILDKVLESLKLVQELQGIVDSLSMAETSAFLRDAERFIRYFQLAIKTAPLQVYASLALAPQRSVIRQRFIKDKPSRITKVSTTELDWNSCQTLEGHPEAVSKVAFSPINANWLASASTDGTIKIWNTATGECLRTLYLDADVYAVVFSPTDASQLASMTWWSRAVQIWDITTGECGQTLEHDSRVMSVAFSPTDATQLASGLADQKAAIWNTATGECVHTLMHEAEVRLVAFSTTDANQLVSLSDHTVRIWNITTGECVRSLDVGSSTDVAAFSPVDTSRLALDSFGVINILNLATGEHVRIGDDNHPVNFAAFSPTDTNQLAMKAMDPTVIKIWNIATGEYVQAFRNNSPVWPIAFSTTDANQLAIGSLDGTVKLWNRSIDDHLQIPNDHARKVTWMIISPANTSQLASGSDDHNVKIWNATTGECVQRLRHSSPVSSIAFSPTDANQLASSSNDRAIKIWNIAAGECVETLEGHSSKVSSLIFSPANETRLASGSADGVIKIWDISMGECVQTLCDPSHSQTSMAFSTIDANQLASASLFTVTIWDITTGGCVQVDMNISSYIDSMAFSPTDRNQLALSSWYSFMIWNMAADKFVQTLKVAGSLSHIAFDPTGAYVLSSIGRIRVDDFSSSQVAPLGAITITAKAAVPPPVKAVIEGYGLSGDRTWITRNGRNILWLPPEYRLVAECNPAILGQTVCIGCASGRVLFFYFA